MRNKSTFSKLIVFCALLLGVFYGLLTLLPWVLRLAPEPIPAHAQLFTEGTRTTLYLTAWSGLFGLLIGMVLALGSRSDFTPVKALSGAVVSVMRGTPLLVQILFAYFALPALFPSLNINDFSAAVIALTLNVGAYNSEIFRSGINAVPKGQTEAARSLGLTRFQTFFRIVFPQAFRLVLPPLVNNLVALLKDSSLASSIGLLELALAGNRVSSETFMPVPILTTVACIYFVFTMGLTLLSTLLEKQLKTES